MAIPDLPILTWIIVTSLIGGLLSVAGAGLVALNARQTAIPKLISFAIGAMLGAVFIEILPEAINATILSGKPASDTTVTVLLGILLFFTLEKLVIWRHCHGDHCEVHAVHTEENCPENLPKTKISDALQTPALNTKYRAVTKAPASNQRSLPRKPHFFAWQN